MVQMLLRPYRAGDLDALYAMDVACFAPPYRFTRGLLAKLVRAKGAVVLLACEEPSSSQRELLLGFCIFDALVRGEDRVGYLSTLDVGPAFRRRGIGRELLAAAERALQSSGVRYLGLHVAVANASAIRFYEECGYRLDGREADFYGAGLDAFLYRKRLEGALGLVEDRPGR